MKFGMMLAGVAMAMAMAAGGCDTLEDAGYFTPVDAPDGARTGVWTADAPDTTPPATGGVSQMPAPTATMLAVTGQNVKVIKYGFDTLVQEANGEWASYTGNGVLKALFTEASRTDDAVVLKGVRVVNSTFNFKTMTASEPSPLSDALQTKPLKFASAAPAPRYVKEGVNGRNVTRVDLGDTGARAYMDFEGRWFTRGGGMLGNMTETMRDDWSVYFTASEGTSMQIDLHRKMVSLGRNGAPRTDYLPITAAYQFSEQTLVDDAAHDANTAVLARLMTIVLADGKGTLLRDAPGQGMWELRAPDGTSRYSEAGGGDYGLPSFMDPRGRRIHFDLARGVVDVNGEEIGVVRTSNRHEP